MIDAEEPFRRGNDHIMIVPAALQDFACGGSAEKGDVYKRQLPSWEPLPLAW